MSKRIVLAALVLALGGALSGGCTAAQMITSDSCSKKPFWIDITTALALEAVAVGLVVSGEAEVGIIPALGGLVFVSSAGTGVSHYQKCRLRVAR